jgi:hypothetical protein
MVHKEFSILKFKLSSDILHLPTEVLNSPLGPMMRPYIEKIEQQAKANHILNPNQNPFQANTLIPGLAPSTTSPLPFMPISVPAPSVAPPVTSSSSPSKNLGNIQPPSLADSPLLSTQGSVNAMTLKIRTIDGITDDDISRLENSEKFLAQGTEGVEKICQSICRNFFFSEINFFMPQ